MKSKQMITMMIAALLLILVACTPSGTGTPNENVEPTTPPTSSDGGESSTATDLANEQTMIVLPYMRQCVGVSPQLCLLVAESDIADAAVFYDQIDGFEFEWGTRYELRVAVTEIENPPADASSLRYELLEVVSSEPKGGEHIELTYSSFFITPLENGRFQIGSNGEFICPLDDCDQLAEQLNSSDEISLTLEYPATSGNPMTLLGWQGETGEPATSLGESIWQLTLLNGRAPLADTEIRLEIGTASIVGFTGCNSFGGDASLRGGTVSMGELAITERACIQPDGIMEQEAEFMTALISSQRYEQQGGALLLFNSAAELTLQFVRSEALTNRDEFPLTNTLWKVVALGNSSELTSSVSGNEPTLTFEDDGRVAIFTGCNQGSTGFTIDNEQISFTAIATTLMACSDPSVNEQEQMILALLPQMSQFSLNGSSLILTDEEGGNLISMVNESIILGLTNTDSLDGTAWQLSSFITNETVASTLNGSEITAVINLTQGTISGSAGCNNYTASIAIGEDGSLTIGPAAATRKACSMPDGIMAQEQQFLQQLSQATSFMLQYDQLMLLDSAGSVILQFLPLL